MAGSLWARMWVWLTPPRFDDENQSRVAELLHYFSLAVIVGASLSVIATVKGEDPGRVVFPLTIILVGLVSFVLVRLGNVRLAGSLVTGGLWVITTLSAGTGGGLNQPSLIFYVMTIILAAVLLDERAAVVFTGLSILSSLIMADLGSQGKFSPVVASTPGTAVKYLALYVTLFLAAGTVLYLTGRRIRLSVERLVKSEQEYHVMYATSRRQAQELTLLDQVRTTLAREVNLPALFRTVMESVTEAFGYTQVSLYLLEGDTLVLQDQAGYEHCLARVALAKGVTGRVARTGKPVLVKDVKSDPDFVTAIPGIVSEVCVPLVQDDHIAGVLNVESTQGVSLTEADLRLIVTLSKDIEIAIGRAHLYQGIQRQLAERKKAEKELQQATSFLQQVVDTFPGMIFVTDGQGKLEFVNRYAAQYYASTPEELIAKSTIEIHPSEAEARGFVSDDQEVIRTRKKITREEMNTAPDGEKHWFHTVKVPLLRPDETVEILGISTDITERKKSEEQLRYHADLLQNVSDAIISIDINGKILSWNSGAERIYGWRADEVLGRDLAEFLSTSYPEGLSRAAIGAQIVADDHWYGELSQRSKDGKLLQMQVSTSLLRDSTGTPIGSVSANRDVTSERALQESLRHQEADLRAIIDNAAKSYVLMDANKRVKAVNQVAQLGAQAVFGRNIQPGDLFTEFLADWNRMDFESNFDRALRGEVATSERSFDNPDGQTRIFAFRYFPAITPEGKVTGVGMSSEDITERKNAEEALHESNERFRTLVEGSPAGIYMADEDFHFIYANQRLADMVGYSLDEIMEADFRGFIATDDLDKLVDSYQRRRRGEDVPDQFEFSAIRKDGERRAMQVSITTVRLPDGRYRSWGQILDITERKRAQEELEHQREHLEELVQQRTAELQQTSDRIGAILDSVGEAIMVVKPDGRIEQVNRAFEEQTGYSAAEVERRIHQDVLFDDKMPHKVFEASAHAMRTGTGWRGEMPVRRKDGSQYDAAVTITTMFNPTGQRTAFVGILRDISALKEVERVKDQFVANVSHELRTPITNIKLYLDLVDMKPEKRAIYLQTLKRENTRLENLIEGLLTLSRLDQNRTAVSIAPLNLNELAEEYVADRSLLAQNSHLKLSFKPAAKLPTCDGDSNLLGQVLGILLTNALNYTPSGGAVHVSTQGRQIDGRGWVGLSVTDTGLGIEPGETGKLFTRFFRGKAGLHSGVAGTGLGLAIAKEIVMLHHGQIEAFNNGPRAKKGATFQMWLPVETA